MTKKPPEDLPTPAQIEEALEFVIPWSITSGVSQNRIAKLTGISQPSIRQMQEAYKTTGKITDIKVSTLAGLVSAYRTITRAQRLAALKERTS